MQSRRVWLTFAVGTLSLFMVLGWGSAEMLRSEQRQRESQAAQLRGEQLRLAVWRVESLLAPALAQEALRPHYHYQAYYSPAQVFTKDWKAVPTSAVRVPSPLLNPSNEWLSLHFQIEGEAWSSPQLPVGKAMACSVDVGNLTGEAAKERAEMLTALQGADGGKTLAAWLRKAVEGAAAERGASFVAVEIAEGQGSGSGSGDGSGNDARRAEVANAGKNKSNPPNFNNEDEPASNLYGGYGNRNDVKKSSSRGQSEWKARNRSLRRHVDNNSRTSWTSNFVPGVGVPVNVRQSGLVPMWHEDGKLLLFVRQVEITRPEKQPRQVLQGFVIDWPRLQALVNDEVGEIFPLASLVRRDVDEPIEGSIDRALTTVPALLDTGQPLKIKPAGWTPIRVGLGLAWGMILLAVAVVGMGLRGLLELNRHRLEFVSAVTHELRTPLTTFQMYTDMLAGGMVTDPDKQARYHQTLHGESLRLSHMVQNVLEYARLEDRRWQPTRAPIDAGALIDRLEPQLAGRCARAEMTLIVDDQLGQDAVLSTDADAVERILINLVDNACKYSEGAEPAEVLLQMYRLDGGKRVALAVVDRGPGLPAGEIERVFSAFRRLPQTSDKPQPGVGLGLALARRWARQLGGDLIAHPGPGGRFELHVPLA